MPVTRDNLHDIIAYHAPDTDGLAKIAALRVATEAFIRAIFANTPTCADQTVAIRHATDALMTANRAVVLDGQI